MCVCVYRHTTEVCLATGVIAEQFNGLRCLGRAGIPLFFGTEQPGVEAGEEQRKHPSLQQSFHPLIQCKHQRSFLVQTAGPAGIPYSTLNLFLTGGEHLCIYRPVLSRSVTDFNGSLPLSSQNSSRNDVIS
ncbi:hypothetical protein FKM82_013786 [Ascaphus truei]